MATPVMRNHAEAVMRQEKHLAVPSVRAQWPAVRERYDGAFAPVFVVDRRTIFHCNRAHVIFSLSLFAAIRSQRLEDIGRFRRVQFQRTGFIQIFRFKYRFCVVPLLAPRTQADL
jgi:hypothetical protein